MTHKDPLGIHPEMQLLLNRSDEVFKEIKELLFAPDPDFSKLKELDEEGQRLAEQMAATVHDKHAAISSQQSALSSQHSAVSNS